MKLDKIGKLEGLRGLLVAGLLLMGIPMIALFWGVHIPPVVVEKPVPGGKPEFAVSREVHPSDILEPLLFGVIVFLTVWAELKKARDDEAKQAAKRAELEKKADTAPSKLKPVWELARFTLENYFQRNLSQVRQIFYVSAGAMIAGFLVITWGIVIAFRDPLKLKIALIASASGILTEFISITFMAIYKSTMAQANSYVAVLERINTVGMAMQILDSMAGSTSALKETTRAEIIRLLLSEHPSTVSQTLRTGENQLPKAASAQS